MSTVNHMFWTIWSTTFSSLPCTSYFGDYVAVVPAGMAQLADDIVHDLFAGLGFAVKKEKNL